MQNPTENLKFLLLLIPKTAIRLLLGLAELTKKPKFLLLLIPAMLGGFGVALIAVRHLIGETRLWILSICFVLSVALSAILVRSWWRQLSFSGEQPTAPRNR